MRIFRLAALFLFLAGAANAAPVFLIKATAYCGCVKCCGKWAKYGKTRVGRRPRSGYTVAADPTVLPLGTCLRISNREYRVEDVGSAIKGNRVDIFFDKHEDARNFGIRKLTATFCY